MTSTSLHPFLQSYLVEPDTHQALHLEGTSLRAASGREYELVDGIPCLLTLREEGAHHREHYRIDAEEFDYFDERDPATEHDEERLRQSILRQLPKSPQNLLDVGCGRAWVAERLCPRGITVCSLDVSITNPRKALQLYPFANHCAVVADAMVLPFPNAVFDCIIASEIIEHLPDPAGFVTELLRVLKPGGRLIVSTPYKEKLRYVLCVHCNQRTPLHAHIQSFDEERLRSLAPSQSSNTHWQIFGNKALLFLRSYVVLQYLPYGIWRFIDRIANMVLPKISHIVMVWTQQRTQP